MTKEDKNLALKGIKEVIEKHDYPFRYREDFIESRFSWDDLSEAANDFYYQLLSLQNLIEQIIPEKNKIKI